MIEYEGKASLYACDPEKNKECPKTECYTRGKDCYHTTQQKYAMECFCLSVEEKRAKTDWTNKKSMRAFFNYKKILEEHFKIKRWEILSRNGVIISVRCPVCGGKRRLFEDERVDLMSFCPYCGEALRSKDKANNGEVEQCLKK